jgi:hypothetical protein
MRLSSLTNAHGALWDQGTYTYYLCCDFTGTHTCDGDNTILTLSSTTRDRGKWISCQGRVTMPVYHPAALLRDPSLKRDTWDDFKRIVYKYRDTYDPNHYSAHV